MISQVSHQQLLSGNRVKLTDIKSLETSISKDFCLISNETDYVLSTVLRSLFYSTDYTDQTSKRNVNRDKNCVITLIGTPPLTNLV